MSTKTTGTQDNMDLSRISDPSSITQNEPGDKSYLPSRSKYKDPNLKSVNARDVFGYINSTTEGNVTVDLSFIADDEEDESNDRTDQIVDRQRIEDEIASFESNYGMTSKEFLEKWVTDKVDNIPFASVWASLYELKQKGYQV